MMKKLTIIIGLALLSNMTKAQLFRNYFYLNDYNYENNAGSLYVNADFEKQEVKEVATKLVSPKYKLGQTKYISKYNSNGVGYSQQKINKKGKIWMTRTYHLIDTLRYDRMESVYKKDTFTTVNFFNDKNKIIEIQYYNKKNKKYSTNKYSYNNKNKLAAMVYINKNGIPNYKYEYDYYDNGSKKETRFYNKKNKLKKIYSYDCEPTGVVKKKVTQQNICKKRTYNPDSSYFEIFEGRDNKGHTSRRIIKYSKDSTMLEETFFNKNDKETKRMVYGYQNKRFNLIQYFNKGKLKNTTLYAFNEKGLTESYKVTNAKGKVKRNYIYEYSYF